MKSRPYISSRPLVHAVGMLSTTERSPIMRTPARATYFGLPMMSTTALDSRCSGVSCLPIANIVFSLLLVGGEHVVVVHCPLSKFLVGHHDLAVRVLLGTTTIGEHTLRFLVEAHHVVHP